MDEDLSAIANARCPECNAAPWLPCFTWLPPAGVLHLLRPRLPDDMDPVRVHAARVTAAGLFLSHELYPADVLSEPLTFWDEDGDCPCYARLLSAA